MSNKLEGIGKKIHQARKRSKMTQAELAERVGCSVAHISSIECGKINMGMTTFIGILEALNLSADWVVGANTSSYEVKLKNEFNTILDGCSPSEIEIIFATVKNLKESLGKLSLEKVFAKKVELGKYFNLCELEYISK